MEITVRIQRDELHELLATMSPAEQQRITKRTFVADIEEEIARQLADDAPVRFATSTPPPVVIRSTPSRNLGHTVEVCTLPEPVTMRVQRRIPIDPRYLAMLVAIIGCIAVYLFR